MYVDRPPNRGASPADIKPCKKPGDAIKAATQGYRKSPLKEWISNITREIRNILQLDKFFNYCRGSGSIGCEELFSRTKTRQHRLSCITISKSH